MQIKILSVGDKNSLSAQTYLPKIAKCDSTEIITGNLSLPDSSLQAHSEAFASDEAVYTFECTSEGSVKTDIYENFTPSRALDWFDWNYITIQQKHSLAGASESYFPYLTSLAEIIRRSCPKATLIINEPWAYEQDCISPDFSLYNNSTDIMAEKIRGACIEAADRASIRIVFPVGEAWSMVREEGFCRLSTDDGMHAFRTGEFLSSAIWYEILTGKNITKNRYRLPFVPSENTAKLKEYAHIISEKYSLRK